MRLVSVFTPTTDEDILAIVALLEAREVPCFVHDTRARSPSSGMQVRARRPRTIMVPAERSDEAVQLIAHMHASRGPGHGAAGRLSWWSKLRSLIKIRVFQWFEAGRGIRSGNSTPEIDCREADVHVG